MEDIELKFKEIKMKTESGFHDACLNEICINLENREVRIKLENCKFDPENNKDDVYESLFNFKNVESFYMEKLNLKKSKNFEKEISSFVYENNNTFKLTCIDGDVLIIQAKDFIYSEHKIKEYQY